MPIDNYYRILGLSDFCTDQDKIKDAYRSQIKYFHPDSKNVSQEIAESKTKDLNVAYDVLSNPQKKQLYDSQLRYEQSGSQQYNSSYTNTRTTYNNTYSSSNPYKGSNTNSYTKTNANSYTYTNNSSTNQNTYRGNYTSYNNTNYYSNRRRKTGGIGAGWIWLIFFFLMLGMCSGGGGSSSSSNKPSSNTSSHTPSTTTQDPDANLTPVSVSNGQYIVRPKDEQITYVQVKTSGSYNYYVYLKDKTHSGRNDTAVYIKGGNTVKIEVPAGKYELYYCTGETWYGKTHKFGSKTRGTKFDDILDCTETSDGVYYYEVTLYAVSGGNATTESVDMDDFPG